MCTVEAVLRCNELASQSPTQFLVGFRDVNHAIPSGAAMQTSSFVVRGVYIQLGRRLPYVQRSSAQPTDFLSLCQRTLAPLREEGDEWFGYEFRASLNVVDWGAESFALTDVGHPDSAVEFAHLLPPYVAVRYRSRYSFPSFEDLIGEFENRWWPLGLE
jgi:hypothetical protein